MAFSDDPLRAVASGGGRLLATATAGVAAVRRAAKPLHPEGHVVTARVRRFGAVPATGVPWLDEEGTEEVLVRASRAVGLPDVLPDIHGLAVRIPFGERHGDLLLASTGVGRFTRFMLTGSRSLGGRPMTTLLPYHSPSGPVLIGAVPRDEKVLELAVAQAWGPWRPFGELVLPTADSETWHDEHVDFDPLLNTVPGLSNYRWVEELREASYLRARRSRGD